MRVEFNYFGGMLPSNPSPKATTATYCLDADFDGRIITPIRANKLVKKAKNIKAMYETRCGLVTSEHCETFAEGGIGNDGRVFRAGYDGVWTAYDRDAVEGRWQALGFPGDKPPPIISVPTPATGFNAVPTVVAYLYVNKFGERSQLSAPSIREYADFDTQILVSGIPVPDPRLGVTQIIVCATRTGTESGSERSNPQNTAFFQYKSLKPGVTFTSFNLNQPGDMVETLEYSPPPQRLRDVRSWRNGQLSGIADNCLWFSTPNQYHAWPEAYRMRVYGAMLRHLVGVKHGYVLTDEAPFIVQLSPSAGNPYFHNGDHTPEALPCVSPASAAIYGDSAIYATKDSLMMLTGFNQKALSYWSAREWQNLRPDQMVGVVHDDCYYGFSENASFRLRLTGDPEQALTMISDRPSAAHRGRFDHLYLADDTKIERFAEGTDYRTAIWEHNHIIGVKSNVAAVRIEGTGTLQVSSEYGPGDIVESSGYVRAKMRRVKGSDFSVRITTNRGIRSAAISSELDQL